METLDNIINHPDLKLDYHDKKEDLDIYTFSDNSSLSAIVSVGEVDATPDELFKCVGDNTFRPHYDTLFEEGCVKDVVGTNTY